jgi:RNA ligase
MLKPVNWQKVDKLVTEGYINFQKHPTLDLWIYNYSRMCQYDSVWDNETLQCRGLIVDKAKNTAEFLLY